MNGLLPDPQLRCSAFWYARQAGLLTGDWGGDLEFLRCLGLHAARLGRQSGIPPWQVPEGPYWVFMWPEHVWDAAITGLLEAVAPHGYWAAGDYG